MKGENPYEPETGAWKLIEACDQFSKAPSSDDPVARAVDQLAIAVYLVGATLVDSVDSLAFQLNQPERE